jgi:LmbE family N-acetylglucosaminyl deacetylase
MEEAPQRVLVITPHPDDAEVWCGGTVARWIKEGAEVYFVLCTDGGKDTFDRQVSSQDLATIREAEQREAADILGVTQMVVLGHPDGELEDDDVFRRELVRQIRLVRPDVVLCPEPYRRNLAWHRDHRIAGQVAIDAVFPYARDHLHFRELWEREGLEPHKTATVLLWGAEQPDTHMDIGDTLEVKIRAVAVYQSRRSGRSESEVAEFVKERAIGDGAGQDYDYAEAFRKLTFRT